MYYIIFLIRLIVIPKQLSARINVIPVFNIVKPYGQTDIIFIMQGLHLGLTRLGPSLKNT